MSGANYNLQAIEQCRAAVSGQVGPMAASGDDLPRDAVGSVFGTLPSSAALAEAVRKLAQTASTEVDKAGTLLGTIDRALDAIGQSVTNNEQASAQSMRA
ncbi:hypothetical protein [Actinokineospora enzanensis]|uniref:hypothetical protein n=1 Tax=Actinokineospora enzanensis TaxID=155975 RepID=UPI00037A332A|nr:hypothetical protein [Actinokineospora enzanensis]